MADAAYLRCITPACAATFAVDATAFRCTRCGALLDVAYDWSRLRPPGTLREFEHAWTRRRDPVCASGVWRFHALMPFASPEQLVTIGEGQTVLQPANSVAAYVGLDPGRLFLQYEGLNPSGSFKDNGMAAAFTHARIVGAHRAACASTGNTSSSLALYCAATGLMRAIVFVGSGRISFGKLAQALDHGALTIQIEGDFDDAMARVQQVAQQLGIYLVNSINPFRLEGQKSIMFRVLEALDWEPPDWIVLPGGNLGNVSAFGKAFHELRELGLLAKVPRLAVINAAGADTFYQLHEIRGIRWNRGNFPLSRVEEYLAALTQKADTIASAIAINRPVNLVKALRAMEICGGVVRAADDREILDAKAQVAAGGFGCEPASAAGVAGLKNLRAEGVIGKSDRVVCILTGHALKDPNVTVTYHGPDGGTFANRPVAVANDLDLIIRAIGSHP